jgi:hypothetical protein
VSWTSPATAVAGSAFTAAMWNTYLRDNLLATEVGIASAASQTFAGTGLNLLAARQVAEAAVATSQGTSSTTFTNLATVGPAVTVTTGDRALVILSSVMAHSVGAGICNMGFAVSGATTTTPGSTLVYMAALPNEQMTASVAELTLNLTPGSNTFTAKYASSGAAGTATFVNRAITVWPF